MFRLVVSVAVCVVLVVGCSSASKVRSVGPSLEKAVVLRATEVQPLEIPLKGPCASAMMEFSGLDWVGDTLVLLPQYPGRLMEHVKGDVGGLCTLTRSELKTALSTDPVSPVTPRVVPMLTNGLETNIDGFEGFEAMTLIAPNKAVLTVEAELPDRMEAWAVLASVDPETGALNVHPETQQRLPAQARWKNFSFEATTLNAGGEILFLYEANGVAANPDRHVLRKGMSLRARMPMSMEPLECRLTDATTIDPETGTFFVTNYCWSGNVDLIPGEDALVTQFGEGPTHKTTKRVERIVALRADSTSVQHTGTPPVYLTLRKDGKERNWEGIARWDGGFLIVTDKFPETILAFVPTP